MFLPYYILKVVLALFDTPLFYLSVKYIKKYINLDFTKKSK